MAAYVGHDEAVNQALTDLVNSMEMDVLPRFAATHGMASPEWDRDMENEFYVNQLPTEAHKARFRQLKADVILAIASGNQWNPLGDLYDGAKNLAGQAGQAISNGVQATGRAINSAVDTVSNLDVNKIATNVRDFTGKVADVTGAISPYLDTAATLTAAIPGVGEVVGGAAALNNGINMGATAVNTAAGLVADNTKPGETVGHALGRARDAAGEALNTAGHMITHPGEALDAAGKMVGECVGDLSKCGAAVARTGATVAGLMGQGDWKDKLNDAADAIDPKKDDGDGKDGDGKGGDGDGKEPPEAPEGGDGKEPPEAPEGGDGKEPPEPPEGDGGDGDKKDDKKDDPAPDGGGGGGGGDGDREGGEREGGEREGGDPAERGGRRGGGERGGRRGGRGERGGRRGRGERGGRRGRGERRGRGRRGRGRRGRGRRGGR